MMIFHSSVNQRVHCPKVHPEWVGSVSLVPSDWFFFGGTSTKKIKIQQNLRKVFPCIYIYIHYIYIYIHYIYTLYIYIHYIYIYIHVPYNIFHNPCHNVIDAFLGFHSSHFFSCWFRRYVIHGYWGSRQQSGPACFSWQHNKKQLSQAKMKPISIYNLYNDQFISISEVDESQCLLPSRYLTGGRLWFA